MLLLSLLLLPLVGAVILSLIPAFAGDSDASRKATGKFSLLWGVLSIALVAMIGMQEKSDGAFARWTLEWIPSADINLVFTVDGISWVFLLLTSLVTTFALGVSLRSQLTGRAYCGLILAMQAFLFGVFTARHFIPFFICWEMTLIPSYLLVRLWGGKDAPRAAKRFFIITLFGGVSMLVGFLGLQIATGTMNFDTLIEMAHHKELVPAVAKAFITTGYSGEVLLTIIATVVFIGLAVKIPVFPFHAWLPDAYSEAPTPVTILLTGVLSKMGVYGLLRVFLMIFPEVLPGMASWITVLAVITVVLGALAALAQTDLKRILAYSSINHLAYCTLAVAAVAANHADQDAVGSALAGTVLQAFNHGIIVCAMFFGVSILERKSGGLRGLNDFGGLRKNMPVFTSLMALALFASLGLPGLSGFVGEFLIFNGVFGLTPWAAAVSLIGLLLTAVFFLRFIRKAFHGPLTDATKSWQDIGFNDRLLYAPVIAIILLLGVWPQFILQTFNEEILRMINLLLP